MRVACAGTGGGAGSTCVQPQKFQRTCALAAKVRRGRSAKPPPSAPLAPAGQHARAGKIARAAARFYAFFGKGTAGGCIPLREAREKGAGASTPISMCRIRQGVAASRPRVEAAAPSRLHHHWARRSAGRQSSEGAQPPPSARAACASHHKRKNQGGGDESPPPHVPQKTSVALQNTAMQNAVRSEP